MSTETYYNALTNYVGVCRLTYGTGARGQPWVDVAYENLKRAWTAMPDDWKENNAMITKEVLTEDGTQGIVSRLNALTQLW
jgi:hypothetical protein